MVGAGALITLLAQPQQVLAQSDDGAQLPDLTVTAVRGAERSSDDLPLSVTVIGRDDLDHLPGRTIDEVLRQVVGVQLPLSNSTAGFPANPSIAIRGVGLGDNGTRTLVLLDGRPMNGAFFGNVFWNRIPLNNVERIEIVRGSSSSQFGSLAIGGVVNIITRPLSSQVEAGVSVRGGNDETIQSSAYVSGALTDQLRVGVDLNYFDTDGYFVTRPEDRSAIDARPNSDISNVGVRVEYDVSEATMLYARAAYFSQDQQGSTQLSSNDTRLVDVNFGFQSKLSQASQLKGSFYYLDEEFANDGTSLVERGVRDAEFISNTHATPSEEFGGSLVWNLQGRGWLSSFSAGVDYRNVDGDDDQDIFTSDGALFLAQEAGGEQQFFGVFAEASLRPIDGLELLPSVRFDHVDLDDGFQNSRLSDGTEEILRFADQDIDRVNARFALRYELAETLALRGAYYRGFRVPTLAELYRRFGTSTFVGQPNADLEEETSTGGEVGFDFQPTGALQGLSTQVNFFQTVVKNQIGGVVVGFGPFTLQNQNIGRIRSRGIELINEYWLNDAWKLDVGYTYTDAKIRQNIDEPELIGNRVEGAPKHGVTAGIRYQQGPWTAQLRGRYTSEQFQDASNETRLPDAFIADAHLAYRWQENWELFVNVENLFDNTYTANAFGGINRIGAPFQVVGGVHWRL